MVMLGLPQKQSTDTPDNALAECETVLVTMDGGDEKVKIHPQHGPVVHQQDGNTTYFQWWTNGMHLGGHPRTRTNRDAFQKPWTKMSSTEKKVMIEMVAKKNRKLREWSRSAGPSWEPILMPQLLPAGPKNEMWTSTQSTDWVNKFHFTEEDSEEDENEEDEEDLTQEQVNAKILESRRKAARDLMEKQKRDFEKYNRRTNASEETIAG